MSFGSSDVRDRERAPRRGYELANAYSEQNDPVEQLRRFEAQASLKQLGDEEAHGIDADYVRALEYGLPPTGGMGLGVDRLVMVLAGVTFASLPVLAVYIIFQRRILKGITLTGMGGQ